MSVILEKVVKKMKSKVIDIGFPTDMRQIVHVSKNSETGKLEGLPSEWIKVLDPQAAADQVNEKPDAPIPSVVHKIKRKAPDIPSKLVLTDEATTEKNNEIEKLKDEDADESQDSQLGQSSEEKNLSQKETITAVEQNESPDEANLH